MTCPDVGVLVEQYDEDDPSSIGFQEQPPFIAPVIGFAPLLPE